MSKKSNENNKHCRRKYSSLLKDLRNVNKILRKDMVFDREEGMEGGWGGGGGGEGGIKMTPKSVLG